MRTPPALALLLCLSACEPGAEGSPAPPGADPALTPIGVVQGPGPRSPREGQTVAVEGVVVGPFARNLGGVFIQSLAEDGDPATAEGLYLTRAPDAEPRLRAGDHVRARGLVVELGQGESTLTALDAAEVRVLGQAGTRPTVLTAPPDDWEALEGQWLQLPGPLTVTGNDGLGRYGELAVSFDGRRYAPTELAAPGPEAEALAAENRHVLLRLDDARDRQDPDRLWYLPDPVSDAAPLRAGSTVSGIEGVLDPRHGAWRLQLTEKLGAVEHAPRPPAPTVPGDRRLVAFNLLNLFNGDGRGGGFPTPRGARTPEQYRAQQAKLVATLQTLDPDVVALMELENDGHGPDSALAQFVAALNAAGPHADWRFVGRGRGPGENPIRVGIVYRATRVEPVGEPATLGIGPFADRSRAPLAQAFRAAPGAPAFLVVANHFKSKGGCDEATGGDADQGDGQACFNATRVESARRLHDWLQGDPTGAAPAGTVLLGDFNAHAMEDPMRLLRELGWRDAFVLAGAERPYSYVFQGLAGRLDHALVDAGLAARLRGAAEWHANADESDRLDYRTDPTPDPWRASDHDPLLLGLDLADPGL